MRIILVLATFLLFFLNPLSYAMMNDDEEMKQINWDSDVGRVLMEEEQTQTQRNLEQRLNLEYHYDPEEINMLLELALNYDNFSMSPVSLDDYKILEPQRHLLLGVSQEDGIREQVKEIQNAQNMPNVLLIPYEVRPRQWASLYIRRHGSTFIALYIDPEGLQIPPNLRDLIRELFQVEIREVPGMQQVVNVDSGPLTVENLRAARSGQVFPSTVTNSRCQRICHLELARNNGHEQFLEKQEDDCHYFTYECLFSNGQTQRSREYTLPFELRVSRKDASALDNIIVKLEGVQNASTRYDIHAPNF